MPAGRQKELRLGNLDAFRDWGFAPDYVEAMWLMLNEKDADDYVIASGETHSVREFAQRAFSMVGLNYLDYIIIDSQLYRQMETDHLRGDSKKATEKLGWRPKTSFDALVRLMVESELRSINATS